MGKTLKIQLLGNFHLTYQDQPILGMDSPRLQSFFAYLLLHHEAPLSRQRLAFQFWPDSTESQSLTNLRNLLYRLRQELPEPDAYLEVTSKTIWWQPESPYSLDLYDFEHALERAENARRENHRSDLTAALEAAASAYQGDLLPGCYDEWIIPERDRLNQAYLRSLEELADLLEEDRAFDRAVQITQEMLRHDPLREESYRRLMNLHAVRGEKARALRVYHTCVDTLEKELGMDPSLATQDLHQQLLNRDLEVQEAPRISEAGAEPIIRTRAMGALQAAWKDLGEQPHLVLLQGEAGSGKSHLAGEFLRWAGRQGITTLKTRSYPSGGELAYTPIAALLRTEIIREKFSLLEEAWLVELSRLLPELKDQFPDLPEPEQLSESWQRGRMFEACARAVLDDELELVVHLDDLHWCDRETLDWLRYMMEVQTEVKMLFLGTLRRGEYRPESPLASLITDLQRRGRTTEILLDPLDKENTRTLAASLWGDDLDEATADQLYRETGGNPLFVVEVVRSGFLSAGKDAGDTPALPPKVQAVIEARLSALSPAARELTAAAAVIGRAFDYPLLSRMVDLEEAAVVNGLDELWGRRLIREEGQEGYNFSHEKFQEVVYGELSPHRRTYLHRRAAAALHELHADRPDKISSRLAVHYQKGGQRLEAVRSYLAAGDQASRVYARQDAVEYYQQAAALLGDQDPGLAVQIHSGLGEVLLKLTAYEQAAQTYQAMRDAAVRAGNREEEALAWLALGKVRDRQGDHHAALDCAERALAISREHAITELLGEALLLKGQSYYRLGEGESAFALIEEALDCCREAGDPFTKSRCLSLLGLIQDDLGKYPEAREYKERALAILETIEGQWTKSWVGTYLNNLANTANLQGEYQRAVDLYQDALAIFREIKDQDNLIMGLVNMGAARVGLGQYQQAEEDFRQVLELTESSGWLGLSLTCHFLAEACLGQDKVEEAHQAACQALQFAEETGARQALGAAWRSLGKIASRSGSVEIAGEIHPAEDCFHRSEEIFREAGAEAERAHTLRDWAEHELEGGSPKKGRKMWQEARDLFLKLEMTAEVEKMDQE